MKRHRRQLAMDFMERTPPQQDTRRAMNESVCGDGKFQEIYSEYSRRIYPGEVSKNGFYSANENTGPNVVGVSNFVHYVEAIRAISPDRSYLVLDVIARYLDLVVFPISSLDSPDPCVRELAFQCSEFLGKYTGERNTDSELVKAAWRVLRPAAALVKGVK